MTVTVRDTDKGYRALAKRLYGIRKPKIKVGILEGAGADESREDDTALTLLFVAICNEFGTTNPVTGEVHVPERSFIRAWFDAAEPKLREDLAVLMKAVVAGSRTKEQVLELMGQRCVGQIQERISQGIDPENAQSTIDQKHSSTPLEGKTGQLRAGVTYLVVDE